MWLILAWCFFLKFVRGVLISVFRNISCSGALFLLYRLVHWETTMKYQYWSEMNFNLCFTLYWSERIYLTWKANNKWKQGKYLLAEKALVPLMHSNNFFLQAISLIAIYQKNLWKTLLLWEGINWRILWHIFVNLTSTWSHLQLYSS